MKRDSNTLTVDALVAAGVGAQEAAGLVHEGVPLGEVGHLTCRPQLGDPLVLAYDAGVPLVVRDGQVRALDGADRLVNTSVAAYSAVVDRYARYVDEVLRASGEHEAECVALESVSEMKALDPGAFAADVLYWPIVCAQMVEGNL